MKWTLRNVLTIEGDDVNPAPLLKPIENLYKRFPDVPAGTLGGDSLFHAEIPRGLIRQRAIRKMIPWDILEDERVEGIPLAVTLDTKKLDEREVYQNKAVAEAMKEDEGVIVGPTGAGKTVIIAMMLAHRKCSTLIMIDRTEIAKQIRATIRNLTGIEPGYIGEGERTIRPITVGLMQSVTSTDKLLEDIGMLIIDEAHGASAPTYLRILNCCPAKYRYGLTATMDGKERDVVFAALGPIIAEIPLGKLQEEGHINTGIVIPVQTDAVASYLDYISKRCWYYKAAQPSEKNPDGKEAKCPKVCTYPKDEEIKKCVYSRGFFGWTYGHLSADVIRNEKIREKTLWAMKDHGHDCAIMLTHLTAHVDILAQMMKKVLPKVWPAHAKMKGPAKRKAIDAYRGEGGLLIATSGIVGKGFDVPNTSLLVRAMPSGGKVSVKQQTGRIMRPQEKKSWVLDFVDRRIPHLKGWWFARRKIYAQIGFEVRSFDNDLFS